MKKAIGVLALVLSGAAHAQYYNSQQGYGSNMNSQSVQGYSRSDGTYVNSYQRSAPNNTQYDNYSTSGNVNPYTGERGYRQPKW